MYRAVAIALGLILAGCGQDAPAPADPFVEAVVPQIEPDAPPTPDVPVVPPENIPLATELVIERVEGLMVSHPDNQPNAVVIFASGIVPSDGWTAPRLVATNPDQTIGALTLKFVATSPKREIASTVPRPVEARLEIEAFPEDVELVRIVSATNELTAFVGN